MSSHTPAPWFIDPNVKKEDHYINISSQEHIGLATAVWRMDGDERTPECEANARLIAAAPELLNLAELVINLDSPEDMAALYNMAKKLIAKVRGEE